MSLVEKVILIAAILMPIIALLIFLPKFLKNKFKNKPQKEKPKAEQNAAQPDEYKPAPTAPAAQNTSHQDDFKDYAERKSKRLTHPKRNFPTPTFADFEGFRPRPIVSGQQNEKTIQEEIKSLSPQLKALIISGALDRKDFDD